MSSTNINTSTHTPSDVRTVDSFLKMRWRECFQCAGDPLFFFWVLASMALLIVDSVNIGHVFAQEVSNRAARFIQLMLGITLFLGFTNLLMTFAVVCGTRTRHPDPEGYYSLLLSSRIQQELRVAYKCWLLFAWLFVTSTPIFYLLISIARGRSLGYTVEAFDVVLRSWSLWGTVIGRAFLLGTLMVESYRSWRFLHPSSGTLSNLAAPTVLGRQVREEEEDGMGKQKKGTGNGHGGSGNNSTATSVTDLEAPAVGEEEDGESDEEGGKEKEKDIFEMADRSQSFPSRGFERSGSFQFSSSASAQAGLQRGGSAGGQLESQGSRTGLYLV
uniref:Uncharacterized protein n=1 Tax=Chromera velia CCMP2878 TaxID=1169474 RepID=A0A0G4HQG5_9ALVE|mmetsp:Transcript_30512/g.59972  ORF Transcript_30512/g.59972 Transcript_30512/m.59972 type:complete len:330 (+) Transcript_30512:169-1158(+)|eukprot:Cvel_1261.t1-p1 / transcript=Cvel_1261.t1 / gene=Cvel_1261 / organism=Chromera_velia_CCMP2878 / gene_product=hypothetical protein / transcript_product=hypothetical protein / location=Cvel_scaffold42:82658-83644(+) / protein_length=329 / sequence_SO=supercontig / SO=protein_coding / is_pseudo=false